MKKGILFIATTVLALTGYSQKTISSSDFGEVGDQVIFSVDTAYTGAVFTGAEGAEQEWYFDFLQNHELDTMDFLDPVNAADTTFPPGSNLALQDSGALAGLTITYYTNDTNNLAITGNSFVLDLTDVLDTMWFVRTVYDDPIHQAQYIMEYEDVWIKTGSGKFEDYYGDTVPGLGIYVDSFRINETVEILDSINGYGTLFLPTDSIDVTDTFDCLRQEIRMVRSFDADVKVENPFWPAIGNKYEWAPVSQFFPQQIPNIHENYVRYWARGHQYPVLEFLLDSAGEALRTRYLYNPTPYIDGTPDMHPMTNALMYPNPAASDVALTIDPALVSGNAPVFAKIFDANGRILEAQQMRNVTTSFSIKDWPSGMYFVHLWSGTKEQTLRFVKE